MKIMFICTGNICRSAMAHWLLKKEVEEKKLKNIEIYSSGTYAINGDTSTQEAIEVMKEYGVDLKKHRATNIRNANLKEMDLILCMTTSHKYQILQIYPELKHKTYTLKEYVEYDKSQLSNINIQDPWGYDVYVYKKCAKEINECLNLLINKIINYK